MPEVFWRWVGNVSLMADIDLFSYRARLGRTFDSDRNPVVDGDTVWFRIDKGFYDYFITNVRLAGIDTREISFVSHDSIEYERGMVHKQFVQEWLDEAATAHDGGWPFILQTEMAEQTGKYGRVLATVHAKEKDEDLGTALLNEFDDVEVYE